MVILVFHIRAILSKTQPQRRCGESYLLEFSRHPEGHLVSHGLLALISGDGSALIFSTNNMRATCPVASLFSKQRPRKANWNWIKVEICMSSSYPKVIQQPQIMRTWTINSKRHGRLVGWKRDRWQSDWRALWVDWIFARFDLAKASVPPSEIPVTKLRVRRGRRSASVAVAVVVILVIAVLVLVATGAVVIGSYQFTRSLQLFL